ncbi:MAG TPA: spore germination protein, partial [Bacillota bacterium]|nr:spore germination protein [Bacillota bacterium]
MENSKEKQNISSSIRKTEKYMTEHLGIGVSFDVNFRQISVLKTKTQLYYVNGLTDDQIVVQLLKKLIEINDEESNRRKVADIIQNRLVHQQV